MNTRLSINLNLESGIKQVQVSLHSLWIGVAAFACAFLLEVGEVNITYPVEIFLKGVITDNTIVEDHLYKLKL